MLSPITRAVEVVNVALPSLAIFNFILSRANPSLFFIYFRPFKHTPVQYLQQINAKNVMSIQYTVPEFELTTFGTRVSSHNHQTKAPALIFLVESTMFLTWLISLRMNSSYFLVF